MQMQVRERTQYPVAVSSQRLASASGTALTKLNALIQTSC